MDQYDCRVFMLLTHSDADGLPLGCLIVTSESRECITLALNLYLKIIPENAFLAVENLALVFFFLMTVRDRGRDWQLCFPKPH